MTLEYYPSAQSTASQERPHEAETHLYGRWLATARVMWMGSVVFALSVFIASLPDDFMTVRGYTTSGTSLFQGHAAGMR